MTTHHCFIPGTDLYTPTASQPAGDAVIGALVIIVFKSGVVLASIVDVALSPLNVGNSKESTRLQPAYWTVLSLTAIVK